MIDEKKLIEEFEKCMNDTAYLKNKYSGAAQLKDCTGKNIMYDHAEIAHNVISEVIEKINEQPKVGEWIPVSERLPENDGFYLATLDGAIVGENRPFTGLAEFEDGKWIDDEEDYKCVIAWQPLPEPYQGGREE